jgi:EmrB/QacA subfamily drug resistance transporter
VQWVVNAYALTFGMAIVTGGRLADMYGRRRIFFIGAAIFAGFSLLGGLAPDAGTLIAMRVAMGIGGALMWPAILGMTYAILPDSRAGLAGGLILGAAGLANAMGPLLGGVLTDALSWRWIFFLNVPIAAIACAVIAARVPKDAEGQREGIDYAGVATLSIGLVLLLVGFDQAGDWGFGDPRVIACFALAIVLVVAFAVLEPRQGDRALVPRDVFSNGAFRATCITVLLFSASFFAIILYAPQFFEKILDWSALQAGVGMLPMLATFGVVSLLAGNLYERLGPKLAVSSGAAGIVIGMFLLSLISDDWEYIQFVPGLAVCGIGFGLFFSAVTTAGVTALDPARASLAGGIIYMFQIAGGAIGLGITTAIFTITSEDELRTKAADAGTKLTEHQSSVLHGLLAGTDTSAAAGRDLGPTALQQVEGIVRDSFVFGIQSGFRYVLAVAAVGFLVALLFVGGGRGETAKPGEEGAPA